MAIVGIIGDTHVPYELEGYLEFCQNVFSAYGVDTVVHIGDLIDHHSLSFHQSEPMLKGAHCERIDARERLQEWYKAFPKLTLIHGNHDLIPQRQLKNIGMDAEVWMKPLKDVYEMPKGWVLEDEIEIDDVLYHHGHTALGVNGFRKDAEMRMQSTVTGHNHSNAGISATATRNRLVSIYDNDFYPIASLMVEAAELADLFVKPVLRGDAVDVDRTKLVSEAGDVLWNLAVLLKRNNIKLEDVAVFNIEKLKSRMARGVIQGSGGDR
jgi:predicted phosphodiesterase/NTP pyrophosphatase (non-canonical NTP hydrolase)